MNNLQLALRSMTKRRRNNLIKILSLGAGLAVGLILISWVLFERSYDTFFPEHDRLMFITERFGEDTMADEDLRGHAGTPGGMAGILRTEIPGVEAATMSTPLAEDILITTQDKSKIKADIMIADSCLFDVLPRPMIAGDARQTLSRRLYALVSESFAASLGGDPLGQVITADNLPGIEFTIGGVFEDYPKNSSKFTEQIILSYESCIDIWEWDARTNYSGNDRYSTVCRLAPGVSLESVNDALAAARRKYVPDEHLEKVGIKLEFVAMPFSTYYKNHPEVQRATLLLSLIAAMLIAAAVLNYVLIVISEFASRAGEIAIYKCYGAKPGNIRSLILTETALYMVVSLLLAAGLLALFRSPVEELLAANISSLFTPKSVAILLGICLMVLLAAGYVPSVMFSRIPVSSVFRNFSGKGRKTWKLALLAVQFAMAAMLAALVVMVWRAWSMMMNDDPGYDYRNVVYCNAIPADSTNNGRIIDRLLALPEAEIVATGFSKPWDGFSGNSVTLPGEERELFNFADLYWADENYLPLFGIEVVEGEAFGAHSRVAADMLVNPEFARRLIALTGWEDGVVGKTLDVSEHGENITIRGVFKEVRLGTIVSPTTRPTALFFAGRPHMEYIFVRLAEITPDNVQKVRDAVREAVPEREVEVFMATNDIAVEYSEARRFRDAVVLGSVITLLTVLGGMVGYLNSEMARRRKEIALRKVNGATAGEVLRLFLKDIMLVALPAIASGAVAAYFAVERWMENFAVQATLPWWLFTVCGAAVAAVICTVVAANCIRVANADPAESLKSE